MDDREQDACYLRRRKRLASISIAVIAVLAIAVTVVVWRWLSEFSQDSFREYIRSFGWAGWLVMLGLQFLQVFVALIPGELLETGAGYVFGPLWGTVLCYIGLALASSLVFWLTRRFGVKLVEVFVSREKIAGLRFLNTEKKRYLMLFLLFFIPGTPKDLFTYFAGLMPVRFLPFMVLSLVARFPSIITSTVGGHLLGEERYWPAVVLYLVTGAVSLAGLLIYNAIQKRKEKVS